MASVVEQVAPNHKATITFYAGTQTIGGTIAAIEYNNHRVVFDFGTDFRPDPETLAALRELNDDNALRIFLEQRLLPKVDGVYPDAQVTAFPGLIGAAEFPIHTAVIISHLHLDHVGGLLCIDPGIDVYMSDKSLELYNVLSEAGDRPFGHERTFNGVPYYKPFFVGDIKITAYPIDHDCYGASAFIIEAGDKRIAYTGDLRIHGVHSRYTFEYIEAAKHADLLITEGVAASFLPDDYELVGSKEFGEDFYAEKDLDRQFLDLFELKKPILFDFYARNIERLRMIIDTASKTDKQLVLSPKHAFLAKKLLGADVRTTDSLTDADYESDRLLINLPFEQFDSCIDKVASGSIYIHSNSEPLGPFDSRWQAFIDALAIRDIELHSLHSSGHGKAEHIQYVIDQIQPKVLMPVHSLKPYKSVGPNQRILPEIGVTYMIDGGDGQANK
ncbi:MBL fold metallo-hydrolase [Paenibacillus cremeus]|nr:MBL fold metallo-hydrolase [Paenibacillus cremeus]